MTIIEQIKKLKKELNATILAHFYQSVAVQEVADYSGDSLGLSIKAQKSDSELIVFCGVRFMAETAAMLSPHAKVLLPVEDAGCPMADMITPEQLIELKKHHPGAAVVCYVNSSAAVKAESDICCTSSNAVEVLKSLPEEQEIIFVPDVNLGTWAARQSGRKVIVWNGFCPIHQWGFERRRLDKLMAKHPGYTVLAHPECDEDIVEVADHVLCTSAMLRFIEDNDEVIVATDHGFTEYARHLWPEKQIISLNSRARCKNMQKTTLHSVLDALVQQQYLVTVPPEIASRAVGSINRMLEVSR